VGRLEKSVFLSYRRANISWALAIFHHLTHHGYGEFPVSVGKAAESGFFLI
jgi:hypothetical protein